jgi:phospholipid/cholesterol/gamma-HCH transport system substrate-binding protein
MRLEAKIGLFVVAILGALLFLSTQVTSLGKWGQKGYTVEAYIEDASGIEKHTHVSMNGVVIGDVQAVTIEGKKVRLTLLINEGIQIPDDSSVIVAQESLLGAKVLNILVGDSQSYLAPTDVLMQSKRYASFDQTSDSVNNAAKELELLLHEFRATLDDEHRKAIQEAIVAFRNVGVNLNGTISDNRQDLHAAIVNFREMSAGFAQTADTVNQDLPAIMARINSLTTRMDNISGNIEHSLPEAVDKFVQIEDNVSTILVENRSGVKTTVDSAGSFFKTGETAFGRIDSLLSNFTTSELQIGGQVNYMANDGYWQSSFGGAYLPNPETYYLFDIISMDDYSSYPYVKPEKHADTASYYSLQYGKRFNDALMRFGILQSTGGVGLDYFMNNDRLKLTAEVFDFNAVNDTRGDSPHAKVQARYKMLKHLDFYGGWDNFLNSQAQNVYFGFGFSFTDNDIKYLSGAASMAR